MIRREACRGPRANRSLLVVRLHYRPLESRPRACWLSTGEHQTDHIILTHETLEGRMREALVKMQNLPTVLAPIVRLRKDELE